MKIIHTGDIHLGCTPDIGAPWARKRQADIWRTFEDIIRLADEKQADLLLICGDLFHRQPQLKQIKAVNQLFASIKDTEIVITAGNHDFLVFGSPYYSFNWSDNVHFIKSPKLTGVELVKLNTVVHGFSYYEQSPADAAGLVGNIICPDDDKRHILMLHGGDDTHIPLNFGALARKGFDYTALAHIHKPELFENLPMAYCGSPEPLDKTERGPHGCIFAELDDKSFNLRFVPLARSAYIYCKIKITPDTTVSSLRNTMAHIIQEKGSHNIFTFTLIGTNSGELVINTEDYADIGNIIAVNDESTPGYDLDAILSEHKNDLIGRFIDTLADSSSDEAAGSTKINALYYGLSALLKSTDRDGGAK
ncbi:MAG: DNA repair exonuclease [Lachnospiraceae bacterium]|nr:DNA repair exonuclease [Lachnospiraceae bacterium]